MHSNGGQEHEYPERRENIIVSEQLKRMQILIFENEARKDK